MAKADSIPLSAQLALFPAFEKLERAIEKLQAVEGALAAHEAIMVEAEASAASTSCMAPGSNHMLAIVWCAKELAGAGVFELERAAWEFMDHLKDVRTLGEATARARLAQDAQETRDTLFRRVAELDEEGKDYVVAFAKEFAQLDARSKNKVETLIKRLQRAAAPRKAARVAAPRDDVGLVREDEKSALRLRNAEHTGASA